MDRSLLQEVQVISALRREYGQCMSGVVNAVLKQGTEKFEWGAEVFTGGFVFQGDQRTSIDDTIHLADIQNYQLSMSGPVPLPHTVFILSGRLDAHDDYLYGVRMFVPTDSSNFEQKVFVPTGDSASVALGYMHEWSGLVKITNTSFENAKISYQALLDYGDGRPTNNAFRLNPDGQVTADVVALTHGFDWTQTISPKTFLETNLRQNLLETAWVATTTSTIRVTTTPAP